MTKTLHCPNGHMSDQDYCTTCGYHPDLVNPIKICEHEEEVCECLLPKEQN